jgi:capsular exopolysaccharide synthesis family protein
VPFSPDTPDSKDVNHYVAVLRRRKWIIVIAVFAVVASALGFSLLQTPVYESHARVLVQPNQSLFQTGSSNSTDTASMETEIQVMEGEQVRAAVRERLGRAPKITASVVGTTSVLDVAAQSIKPAEASAVANTYADTYVDYRRKQAIDSLLAATKELQQKITDLDRQIGDANVRAAAANPPKPGAPTPQTAEQTSLEAQRAAFKEKFDQVQVDVALKDGGAQVVTRAGVPASPVRPTTLRNTLLALLVGLIVGTGMAFVSDQLDDSLKTKDDLERAAGGLPVLGVIPKMTAWKNKTEPRLVSMTEPNSPAAEAYRTLRTSIQFIGVDRSMRTLQVTSPTASDGKTTTIANLAVALARAGQRVTVVSCDLRRPRIHEFFGVPDAVGFTSVLVGAVPLSAALLDVDSEYPLRILPSGPIPPNPSELLSSRRAAQVITAIAAQSDVVLIDCPPVLPVTDAAVLSSQVDATLLVATTGSTTGKQLHRAVELLHQVNAPLVGVLMNGAPPEEAYGYGYGYYRYEARPGRESPATAVKTETNDGKQPKRRKAREEVPAEPSSS